MAKNLVIVESPAKARTIKNFLWKDFEIKACMWHIYDLEKKWLWIDIENWFEPHYKIIDSKKKIVSEFKKLKKTFDEIILATDEDREWEAIAYHIAQILWLDEKKTKRIVFHEITKNAILNSLDKPRIIDMNLVYAQQWRRLLDRIVWFKTSPILWQKVKRWLSAGRVQSVALKLIVEKEIEIKNFIPQEYYTLNTILKIWKHEILLKLEKYKWKPLEINDFKNFEKILNDLWVQSKNIKQTDDDWKILYNLKVDLKLNLIDIDTKDHKISPPAPFITSTLQQEWSKRFWWWVKKVMDCAQKLYENWFITYMRTDSVSLSDLAIWQIKSYILNNYWENYLKVRKFKNKVANAQEAHEAIRPTNFTKNITSTSIWADEKKLYNLIFDRTVWSQMSEKIIETTQYFFNPIVDEKYEFIYKQNVVKFDWFSTIYNIDEEKQEENLKNNSEIKKKLKKWDDYQSEMLCWEKLFTKPPSRYTESTLVKKLESEWIWRPSTYATIITTIQKREYVVKEDKFLKPTDIAFVVNEFLQKYFENLMDYKFTANLEKKLDEIADWKVGRQDMISTFYKWFERELKNASWWKVEKIEVWKNCPECWAPLVYKFWKTWKFIWCSNYPECKHVESSQERNELLENLKSKYEWTPCPQWWTIVVKIWRFWPFLASSLYPEVKRIWKIPDEKKEQLEEKYWWKSCPKCKKWVLNVKKFKWRYFLWCNTYPECKYTKSLKV